MKVFIGAGHGGRDPGAVGNGFYEKDLNLSIALACREKLISYGIDVLMSRECDEDDALIDEIRECNAFAPDFAVDVHCNAGGGRGAEAYCHVGGGRSRELAEGIMACISALGQVSRGVKVRVNEQGKDYYGFIRQTYAPAVIVECGFIDNAEDMEFIGGAEKCRIMGGAIADGILGVLGIGGAAGKPSGAKVYRVQAGAFESRANAEALLLRLKKLGIDGFISEGTI